MNDRAIAICKKEAEAILNIPIDRYGNEYSSVIHFICERVHKRGGKLVVSGIGKAGQIALNIATTFSSTGTPAVFLHPTEAQHGDLGVFQKNDVLMVLSNSGKTRELIELVDLKNIFDITIPVIVITSDKDSPLADQANCLLLTGNPKEVCPLGLTPTTSTTVMSVIGDILVVLMMEKIGFTTEDYYKRHHGGYLGQKSKSILNRNKIV